MANAGRVNHRLLNFFFMNDILFENTKIAAYFLWEATGCGNALGLWTCAEDIGSGLEARGVLSPDKMNAITDMGLYSSEYIGLIRHIAFKIFVYTGQRDQEANWFIAEALARSYEWRESITHIARIYSENKSNFMALSGVRSSQVRQNYA